MATSEISKGQPGSKRLFKDSYLLHKLHSLTGVLPIGMFLIFHFTANAYSLRGAVEFDTAVRAIGYAPFILLLEAGVITIAGNDDDNRLRVNHRQSVRLTHSDHATF